MNKADVYAVGCLLVWGIPLGIACAMFFLRRKEAEKKAFSATLLFVSIIVATLQSMVLCTDNPDYLGGVLVVLAFLLTVAGVYSRRITLYNIAILWALFGTLVLFFSFHSVVSGFSFKDARLKARLIALSGELKYAAKNDTALYPAGRFDETHPAFAANPDLKNAWQLSARKRTRLWHTGFTGLSRLEELPPPNFLAGTIADNQARLQEYLDLNTRRKDPSPEFYPVLHGALRVGWYAIPVLLGLFITTLIAALFLRRKHQ